MQLKPNTYYRTRDGRRFFFAGFRPDGVGVGWHVDADPAESRTIPFNLDGSTRSSFRGCDLIAIWTDRPKDEPGWEIVEDFDLVPKLDWQVNAGDGWKPVAGNDWRALREAVSLFGMWRWFRRPVKREPREFVAVLFNGIGDTSILGHLYEDCESISEGWEQIRVREVIDETEPT